jgi:hypothetical protein
MDLRGAISSHDGKRTLAAQVRGLLGVPYSTLRE